MGQGGQCTYYQLCRDEVVAIDYSPQNGLQDQPEVIEVLTDTSGERETCQALTNLYEISKPNTTQAYMLFYVKLDERDQIIQAPPLSSIPQDIQTRFEAENAQLNEDVQLVHPESRHET